MQGTPLSLAMIQMKAELKAKITELRGQINLPPYVINAVLADIMVELKEEEKEGLAALLFQSMADREEAKEDADTAAQD